MLISVQLLFSSLIVLVLHCYNHLPNSIFFCGGDLKAPIPEVSRKDVRFLAVSTGAGVGARHFHQDRRDSGIRS